MALTLKESKSASHGRHLKLLSLIEKGTHGGARPNPKPNPDPIPLLEDRADKIIVWREFPKQNQAIDFAKKCRYNVGVFSFESAKFGTSGQRHFIVSAYHTFVHRYFDSIIQKCKPHFYEVIVEGAVCKVYFDIEYQKLINPSVDGVKLLNIFIQYVNFCLDHFYGIVCDRRSVLDLESSSEKKFSRHLIYHFPNAIFHSNRELGKFVAFICDELRHLESTGSFRVLSPKECIRSKRASWRSSGVECPDKDSLLQLFILNDKGSKVLICDEGVYSKNRNFRLYLSSKLGKEVVLKLSPENKFIPLSYDSDDTDTAPSKKHINCLFNSLIAHVPCDHNLKILTFESLIPTDAACAHFPSHGPNNPELLPVEFQDSSPYPPLDAFIRALITRDGSLGRIRRVSYFPEGKLVIFDITAYRYCENIQRHHKSNNIMLLANLERLVYYQKCHDPDCKKVQFKSSDMPIPPEVVSECFRQPEDEFQDLDMENFESDFDDDISDDEWGRISEKMETSVTYNTEP